MKTSLCLLLLCIVVARAQTSIFTYQGRLAENGRPANGSYDLRFTLYDGLTGGSAVGGPFSSATTSVSDGQFTAALDFGAGALTGADRWLEIAVRTNGSAGVYQVLSPRQQLTSTPYAVRAANFSGAVAESQLPSNIARLNGNQTFTGTISASSFAGNAGGLTNVATAALSGPIPDATLSANVARLAVPNTASAATGHPIVTSGFITSAIIENGGNGYPQVPAPAVTVNDSTGAGAGISATVSNGMVVSLTVTNPGSGYSPGATLTISAPPSNAYQAFASLNLFSGSNIFTGVIDASNGSNAFSGRFSGSGSALSNVNAQTLNGLDAGQFWRIGGNSGTVAGPNFIGTTDDQPLEIKAGGARALRIEPNTNGSPNLIGGAAVNFVDAGVVGVTIAGGGSASANLFLPPGTNRVLASFGTIGGGNDNLIRTNTPYGTVAGGSGNTIETGCESATIAGGEVNAIQPYAYYSTVGGGLRNTIQTNSWDATISGGALNAIKPLGFEATIAGGFANTNGGASGTIGGGYQNAIGSSASATIGGGYNNIIGNGANYSTIPGGYNNRIADNAIYSFAAGQNAQALHSGSFVWCDFAGGLPFSSTANNQFAVRAFGGVLLYANVRIGTGAGDYRQLTLGGGNSDGFLYGSYPRWGDGIHLGYNYYADAGGGNHVVNTGGATSRISVSYGSIVLATGGVNAAPTTERLVVNTSSVTVNGTFNNNSDRNAKQDFQPVNPSKILDRVAQLPLSEWSYKDDPATRHLGPMAQDFSAAFSLGTDDKHIAPIDEGGVALAAVQGLNEKLEREIKNNRDKDSEISALKSYSQRLEKRLAMVERAVQAVEKRALGE